jgi:hypothetical protein
LSVERHSGLFDCALTRLPSLASDAFLIATGFMSGNTDTCDGGVHLAS